MCSNSQVHVKRYAKVFRWLKCQVSYNKRVRKRCGVRNSGCRYDQCICLVFVSFQFLCIIHNLTFWMHSCVDWMSSSRYCDGAEFCNWKSSAKEWWRTEWLPILSERGAVCRQKRAGPRTDPCGTPITDGHWGRASFWQLQYGFCLRGEIKITIGEQYCVCQKYCKTLEEKGMVYCIKSSW